MTELLPVLLGIGTGVLLGLTGAGGGVVAAPLLILTMHQSVTSSAPIALAAVSLGSAVGVLMGLREGIVRYRAALLLSLMGLLASPVGIHLARLLPNRPLLLAFALLLLFQGWRYWRAEGVPQDQHPPCQIHPSQGRFIWNRRCTLTMMRMGLFTGFLSGLLGVGGGFILVPAMRRHTPLSIHSIAATSLMVLTIVSTGGLLQWMALGNIPWRIGIPFTGGVLLGMALGRLKARSLPEGLIRRVFALLCVVVAGSLLFKVAFALPS